MDQILNTPEVNLPTDTQLPTNPPQIAAAPVIQTTKSSPLVPISLGISVIALGVAGFFGYQYFQLTKLQQSAEPAQTTETSTPTPTPSADPTSTWKTFTNNKNKYSIKLPSFITQLIQGPGGATTINDDYWLFAKTDTSLLDSTHKIISPKAAISLGIEVYQDAAQGNYNLHCKEEALSFNQLNPSISHSSLVGNVEQYVQSTSIAAHSTYPNIKYWNSKICFMKDGLDYEIYYENYENSYPDPYLDQILSTFRFSDQPGANKPTTSTKLPSASEVKAKAFDHLVSTGNKRDEIKITDCSPLGNHNDKFTCSYFINDGPGGSFLLIGKVNDEWIIPEGSSTTYCDWISESGLDEGTKAFLGSNCPFNK